MYCKWLDINDPIYVKYHEEEWGRLNTDDHYLFMMLILESFQAGLSWKCILDKRAFFFEAYDGFAIEKVIRYDQRDVKRLLETPNIIHNEGKIKASIQNAKVFKKIIEKYGSFYDYLKIFTKGRKYFYEGLTYDDISIDISKDLKKKGMSFIGPKIIFAYLEAIGVFCDHDKDCHLYKALSLYEPKIDDDFEIELYGGAKTMAYNKGYDIDKANYDRDTGQIFLSKDDLYARYHKRQMNDDKLYYIKEDRSETYIGIVAYYKDDDHYALDIITKDAYRHQGYFDKAMYLLLEKAKEAGIKELYDSFECDRGHVLEAFMDNGFIIDHYFDISKDGQKKKAVLVKISL